MNKSMMNRSVLAAIATVLVAVVALTSAAIYAQGLTSQSDNSRTNANQHETTLTPANVNPARFGRIFALRVDGDIYAQPLYVPHLAIPGKGTHNVLFVATEHDSVYAFDADQPTNEPLWHVNFLKPGSAITTVPARDVKCPFIQPEIGITPTPVIDLQTGTLYVLARTKEAGGLLSSSTYAQRLHALALTTGAEKNGSPVLIEAPGFDALRELPRAALLLANNQIFLTWGSSCDVGPYHGWVMAYDKSTLTRTALLNTSPVSGESGIWQSDNGPAADQQGNVYAVTGNGKFNVSSGGRDYGDSVLKLGLEGRNLIVRDYFTPFDERALNAEDDDLGSGGPILLPDQPGPHPHLLLAGGKNGVLYVLDRDRLGHYQPGSNSHAVQALRLGGGIYAAPAYWNGHVYILASNDYLSDFVLTQGRLSDHPAVKGTHKFGNPGATPAISADGVRNGIVWLIETKAWNDFSNRTAVLHAYDANDVSHELYNSEEKSSRDRVGAALRFTVPTVINGRVYVPAKGEVDVYGLLSSTHNASN
jgi:hypothetical protein